MNLPAMQEIQVQYLGRKDPLKEEMETHSSILDWRIPWTEETDGLQFIEPQRVTQDWATNTLTLFHLTHIDFFFLIPKKSARKWQLKLCKSTENL